MNDNTQRFTGRAKNYHRYRQRYPARQVLEHLRAWCGLSRAWTIADIGAGTGMLSEVFLENGNRVFAVEPNAEMRHACAQLTARWPELHVTDATAEATTLPEHSADLVAAGRAFHWFDKSRALREFRRIVKPGGWLALVSQGRALAHTQGEFGDQAGAFERLLVEHGTDPSYVWGGYRVHEDLRDLFPAESSFKQVELPGTQTLDWKAFLGQTMSLSMAPQTDHPAYDRFTRALRELFDTYAIAGQITVPTTCYLTGAEL